MRSRNCEIVISLFLLLANLCFAIDHCFGRNSFRTSYQHAQMKLYTIETFRGGSYTESQEWLKSKKAVTNPQNKDEQLFKWAVIEALHREYIKHHPERISLLRPHEKQYS